MTDSETESVSSVNYSKTPFNPPKKLNENDMAKFKKEVKKWIKIDNDIKEAMTHIKTLKDKKNELENVIKTYMDSEDINTVNVSQEEKIEIKMVKRAPSLSKKTLTECLQELFDEQQVGRIVEHIYDWRKRNTKEIEKSLGRKKR